MPNKTCKSLVASCQDTLAKYLDALTDVGCVPYALLKPSLVYATPQQLYNIEKANPDIAKESDELWLKHCLLFRDIREEYEKGMHQDPEKWREIYLHREEENERKRQAIKEKVKSQYSKIQNEKEKKSIKVLHGLVPTNGRRSYEAARRSTMSKLFQQTRKETDKYASIYHAPKRNIPTASTAAITPPSTFIRIPKIDSPLAKAYQSYQTKYPPKNSPPRQHSPPLIAPASRLPPPPRPPVNDRPLKKPKLDKDDKKKKPAAVVNFNIFNELS